MRKNAGTLNTDQQAHHQSRHGRSTVYESEIRRVHEGKGMIQVEYNDGSVQVTDSKTGEQSMRVMP